MVIPVCNIHIIRLTSVQDHDAGLEVGRRVQCKDMPIKLLLMILMSNDTLCMWLLVRCFCVCIPRHNVALVAAI